MTTDLSAVSIEMILRASQRATELIRNSQEEHRKTHPARRKTPPSPCDISLSYEKCDRDLGLAIKPKAVDQILERFGLIKHKSRPDKTRSIWKIPSYRRDLQRDVDLIEEVVRAHGVEKIVGTDRSRFTPSSAADRSHDLESELRAQLVAYGLSEARTSKLIPRAAMRWAKSDRAAQSPERRSYRLQPNLSRTLAA
jgi:phenylalanyl-tRNA synthetase beta chain